MDSKHSKRKNTRTSEQILSTISLLKDRLDHSLSDHHPPSYPRPREKMMDSRSEHKTSPRWWERLDFASSAMGGIVYNVKFRPKANNVAGNLRTTEDCTERKEDSLKVMRSDLVGNKNFIGRKNLAHGWDTIGENESTFVEKLIDAAFSASGNDGAKDVALDSYGASLITKSGKVYSGCNVRYESSCSSPMLSAEKNIILKATYHGEFVFQGLATASHREDFVLPDGSSRQYMAQFGNFPVFCVNGDRHILRFTTNELYPQVEHLCHQLSLPLRRDKESQENTKTCHSNTTESHCTKPAETCLPGNCDIIGGTRLEVSGDPRNWSTHEVVHWLQNDLGMAQYTPCVLRGGIDGRTLMQMEQLDLLLCGITDENHCEIIRSEIEDLRNVTCVEKRQKKLFHRQQRREDQKLIDSRKKPSHFPLNRRSRPQLNDDNGGNDASDEEHRAIKRHIVPCSRIRYDEKSGHVSILPNGGDHEQTCSRCNAPEGSNCIKSDPATTSQDSGTSSSHSSAGEELDDKNDIYEMKWDDSESDDSSSSFVDEKKGSKGYSQQAEEKSRFGRPRTRQKRPNSHGPETT